MYWAMYSYFIFKSGADVCGFGQYMSLHRKMPFGVVSAFCGRNHVPAARTKSYVFARFAVFPQPPKKKPRTQPRRQTYLAATIGNLPCRTRLYGRRIRQRGRVS